MTTETTIQELLKPRVKVIAPWPEMERWLARVGDILTDPGGNETVRNQNGDAVPAFEWETFPHLFRKLEWHEERNPDELIGAFAKRKDGKHVTRINAPISNDGAFFVWDNMKNSVPFSDYLPATAAEYNSYISSTDKKEKV